MTDLVGIVPAGGRASRISPIPCSKEILPIGFDTRDDGTFRPRVAMSYLLEAMAAGGVRTAFIVLRPGKWDIPAYFASNPSPVSSLAYLVASVPHGPAYTVDRARPFVEGARVAFGYPDTLMEPVDYFRHLSERQRATRADVVLALLPSERPEDDEMVEREGTRARRILFRPGPTTLPFAWNAAVWSPAFTRFLSGHLQRVEEDVAGGMKRPEVKVGHVIQAAIESGLAVETVAFPQGRYMDFGTTPDLKRVTEALAAGRSPFRSPPSP